MLFWVLQRPPGSERTPRHLTMVTRPQVLYGAAIGVR
ncbi:hypothetical protein E2C01_098456 [Portunus trituberculatus]|uniref:Uncharacterized protein n=1 Tax=Portunus trituberculatus TaxID=210409 RepID=A0A5B7K716_PORTR|nr:hypothetical protein [Portunus trituberculatus]